MGRRRAWLTPDAFEGGVEICRPLVVPLPLLPYVGGALALLTEAHNWEQSGTMTPEEAAELMTVVFASWTGDCNEGGECICEVPADPDLGIEINIRIIRRSSTGHTQELIDGVWSEPEGDYEVPEVPARAEATPQDRRCLAAANAANVLAEMYEEVTDAIAIELSMASVINAIYDYAILIIGAFAGPTAVAYSSFGKTFLDAFVDTANVLGSDVWDSTFTDELTCLLYQYASDSAGVVSFDWVELRQRITTEFLDQGTKLNTDRALLYGQVGYLLDIVAAGGLDHAGTTTAITSYDCDDCEAEWCRVWPWSDNVITPWVITRGTHPSGAAYIRSAQDPGLGNQQRLVLTSPIFVDQVITRVKFNFDALAAATGGTRSIRLNKGGVLVGSLNLPTTNGSHAVDWTPNIEADQIIIDLDTAINSSTLFNFLYALTIEGIAPRSSDRPFGSDNC